MAWRKSAKPFSQMVCQVKSDLPMVAGMFAWKYEKQAAREADAGGEGRVSEVLRGRRPEPCGVLLGGRLRGADIGLLYRRRVRVRSNLVELQMDQGEQTGGLGIPLGNGWCVEIGWRVLSRATREAEDWRTLLGVNAHLNLTLFLGA